MFALVDVNNMYVSCERVFRPALIGKPVVVLSNNDGVCIARSNEAKDLGVKMAQPWFQVRHLQREAGLIALSGNFELYADMSNRMMAIVGEYAPKQEVYSIDESFLDFSGVRADLTAVGRDLRARVLQWTGLPTSVGFGATKTLAKLANHIAKVTDRKGGLPHSPYDARFAQVCNLGELSPAELREIFAATAVGEVYGIGWRISARLQAAGIHNVLELLNADTATLRKQFSVMLERTLLELRGTPCMDIDHDPAPQKQMMCSRSFGAPVTDLGNLIEVVSQFASRVAEKARRQEAVAAAVYVFITTAPFRKHDRQHHPSLTVPLTPPSADTRVIIATAIRALKEMYRPGFNYVKAGVMLVHLSPRAQQQPELDLFGASACAAPHTEAPRLMQALDQLNRRFGRGTVKVASAASQGARATHTAREELRSPRYTTRLEEILTVRT